MSKVVIRNYIMEKSSGSSTCSLSSQEEELAKLLDDWNFGYMQEKLIFLLLHVILRPSIKRKLSNVVYRSTIKDPQSSFLLHAVTVNDVQNRLEQLKTSLFKRGETLQPLIIAVGFNISEVTFYVYYDKIKYKLPSFLTSLDTCFKIFQVLNLKYPRDCSEVWTFIQRYFYGINLKEDQISPNILCLINDLK